MLSSPASPLPPDPQHWVPISMPFRNPRGYCKPRERIKPCTSVQSRWLIKLDMPQVLAIEEASAIRPWSEDDFSRHLRSGDGRGTIGTVAVHGERVVGFTVYRFQSSYIDVLKLAVHPESRRSGVGRQMASRLKAKIDDGPRRALSLCVRETNVIGQVFFRSQGFLWRETLPEHYPDTNEDAYVMEYNRVEEEKKRPPIGFQHIEYVNDPTLDEGGT